MTLRQKVLKLFYPALMAITRLFTSRTVILENKNKVAPAVSFYSLSFTDNHGVKREMSDFKGKKILLANTASNCGYTGQLNELQQLQKDYSSRLLVIGFPSNDFKNQENGSDEAIEQFCTINYGVTFPLAKKSVVIKSGNQNEVFNWLSDPAKNGWNKQEPHWNFCKYLVDEEGTLLSFFGTAVAPLSSAITSKL